MIFRTGKRADNNVQVQLSIPASTLTRITEKRLLVSETIKAAFLSYKQPQHHAWDMRSEKIVQLTLWLPEPIVKRIESVSLHAFWQRLEQYLG